jgi:hypothetical protein
MPAIFIGKWFAVTVDTFEFIVCVSASLIG